MEYHSSCDRGDSIPNLTDFISIITNRSNDFDEYSITTEFQDHETQQDLIKINIYNDCEDSNNINQSSNERLEVITKNSSAKSHHKSKNYKTLGKRRINLKCDICDSKFTRLYDLKVHINIHLGINLHICKQCGKKFNNSSNLLRHLRIHSKIKPYPCDKCYIRFSHLNLLQYHKICHITNGKCPICASIFKKFSGLEQHLRKIHNKSVSLKDLQLQTLDLPLQRTRQYICFICGQVYSLKKQLDSHESETHLPNDYYPCGSCLFIYKTIYSFKTHECSNVNSTYKYNDTLAISNLKFKCILCSVIVEKYENAKLHKCDVNSKLFSDTAMQLKKPPSQLGVPETKGILGFQPHTDAVMDTSQINKVNSSDEHVITLYMTSKSENEIKTPHIIKVMDNSFNAQKESYSALPNEVENSFGYSNTNKFFKQKKSQSKISKTSCNICNKSFTRFSVYEQHMGTHDPLLRKYHCENCNQRFSYFSTYSSHLLSHRRKTEALEKINTCSYCDKVYGNRRSLSQHVRRVHLKEQNYSCLICDKTFFDKSVYEFHNRIHTNESPYVCSVCGKEFKHISHVYRHERSHSRDYKHKCEVCSKTFSIPSLLNRHVKLHQKPSSVANLSSDLTCQSDSTNSALEKEVIPL